MPPTSFKQAFVSVVIGLIVLTVGVAVVITEGQANAPVAYAWVGVALAFAGFLGVVLGIYLMMKREPLGKFDPRTAFLVFGLCLVGLGGISILLGLAPPPCSHVAPSNNGSGTAGCPTGFNAPEVAWSGLAEFVVGASLLLYRVTRLKAPPGKVPVTKWVRGFSKVRYWLWLTVMWPSTFGLLVLLDLTDPPPGFSAFAISFLVGWGGGSFAFCALFLMAGNPHSVGLSDEGVSLQLVFGLGGWSIRWPMLLPVEESKPFLGTVKLRWGPYASSNGYRINVDQARMIFSDPRCPAGVVNTDMATALGISSVLYRLPASG